MVADQAITTVSGRRIAVRIDTVCVHGDTPGAVAMARAVREKLTADGATIAPMAEVLAG